MLAPTQVYLPYRLGTPDQVVVPLEAALPVDPMLQAKVRISNKGTGPVQLIIDETENLGLTPDPLHTGSFTTNRLTTTINPGQVVWHEFTVPYLTNKTAVKPYLTHTIKLKNLDPTPDPLTDIVTISLYGLFEETTRVSPASPSAII